MANYPCYGNHGRKYGFMEGDFFLIYIYMKFEVGEHVFLVVAHVLSIVEFKRVVQFGLVQ